MINFFNRFSATKPKNQNMRGKIFGEGGTRALLARNAPPDLDPSPPGRIFWGCRLKEGIPSKPPPKNTGKVRAGGAIDGSLSQNGYGKP